MKEASRYNGEVVGICMQATDEKVSKGRKEKEADPPRYESTHRTGTSGSSSSSSSSSSYSSSFSNSLTSTSRLLQKENWKTYQSYQNTKEYIKQRLNQSIVNEYNHHSSSSSSNNNNNNNSSHSHSLSQSQSHSGDQAIPRQPQHTHTVSKAMRITEEMTCQDVLKRCQVLFNHVHKHSKGYLLLVVSLPVSKDAQFFHPFKRHDFQKMQVARQIQPDEHPLQIRNQLRDKAHSKFTKFCNPKELVTKPLVRWFYVAQFIYPHQDYYFLELDGYVTTYEDDSDMEDLPSSLKHDHHQKQNHHLLHHTQTKLSTTSAMPEIHTLATTTKKEQHLYTYYRYLRKVMKQYVPCEEPFLLNGWLLRQSQSNPYVWKHVYVTLIDSTLWIIGRHRKYSSQQSQPISNSNNNNKNKHKYRRPRFSTVWTSSSGHSTNLSIGKVSQISLTSEISQFQEYPPHTFGLRTNKNKWIRFRTPNETSHTLWVERLQHTLEYAKENYYMEEAEQQLENNYEEMPNQHQNDTNLDFLLPHSMTNHTQYDNPTDIPSFMTSDSHYQNESPYNEKFDGDVMFSPNTSESNVIHWENDDDDKDKKSLLANYNPDDYSLRAMGKYATSKVGYVIGRAMCVNASTSHR